MNERVVPKWRPSKQLHAPMACPWRLLISVRDGRKQGPVSGKVASMRVGHGVVSQEQRPGALLGWCTRQPVRSGRQQRRAPGRAAQVQSSSQSSVGGEAGCRPS